MDLEITKKKSSYKLNDNFEFSEKECELFDFLVNFIKKKELDLVLRCAGGFVRDKLLGLESSDIDIAVDKMSGVQFVMMLKDEFEQEGEHLSKLHVIKQNPEKSKHLETATCCLFGYEIDFVNLRGEEYAQDSRIPQQTNFGSPLDDALRRDLTINALFYNINQGKLEDFTERGIEDLKHGICMTPMDPLKTFTDDPLRVLRTCRFSSRYNFKIEKSVMETMKKPEVKEALFKKVSPERIGKELTKIFRGNNPFVGISILYESNLWSAIFPINPKCKELYENQQLQKELDDKSFELVKNMNQQYKECQEFCKLMKGNDDDKQILCYLSAGLYPYYPYEYNISAKKIEQVIYDITTNQHRMMRNECKQFKQIVKSAQQLNQWINQENYDQNSEIYFIKLVQWLKESEDLWELSFYIAKLVCLQEQKEEKIMKRFEEFIEYINQHNLYEVYNIQPLLKGDQIAKAFGLNVKKPGPMMRTILWNIFIWQAEFQDKNKEDLIKEIEEEQEIFLTDNHNI